MKVDSLRQQRLSPAPGLPSAQPNTPRWIRSHAGRARRASVLVVMCLVAVAASNANPPAGGTYSLPRQVIAAGGAASSGGSYRLVGTVGQSVTGQAAAGTTLLQQGFHAGPAGPDELFNNGFE